MIVRVSRFGGKRIADPPAWGVLEPGADGVGDVQIFHGPALLLGAWWLDTEDPGSFWSVSDDEVPDEIWAALAKWRLIR